MLLPAVASDCFGGQIADASVPYRTLVYVEGEVSVSQWEDAEGKNRTAMNIVQRK